MFCKLQSRALLCMNEYIDHTLVSEQTLWNMAMDGHCASSQGAMPNSLDEHQCYP